MKVSITSIELKSPLHFFKLSVFALHISNQLKASNCIEFKKKGFWTKHYTMTLWKNEEDMRAFAYSGAHLDTVKKSKLVAKEIRIITIEANDIPKWKEAIILLNSKGRIQLPKTKKKINNTKNRMMELKKYLTINSFFSMITGVTMLGFSNHLNLFFNIENKYVFPVIGLSLVIFSIFVWYVLRKQLTNRILVKSISILDVLWVLGSFIIIILHLFDLSEKGYYLIGIIAIIIGFLGYKQIQYNKTVK